MPWPSSLNGQIEFSAVPPIILKNNSLAESGIDRRHRKPETARAGANRFCGLCQGLRRGGLSAASVVRKSRDLLIQKCTHSPAKFPFEHPLIRTKGSGQSPRIEGPIARASGVSSRGPDCPQCMDWHDDIAKMESRIRRSRMIGLLCHVSSFQFGNPDAVIVKRIRRCKPCTAKTRRRPPDLCYGILSSSNEYIIHQENVLPIWFDSRDEEGGGGLCNEKGDEEQRRYRFRGKWSMCVNEIPRGCQRQYEPMGWLPSLLGRRQNAVTMRSKSGHRALAVTFRRLLLLLSRFPSAIMLSMANWSIPKRPWIFV